MITFTDSTGTFLCDTSSSRKETYQITTRIWHIVKIDSATVAVCGENCYLSSHYAIKTPILWESEEATIYRIVEKRIFPEPEPDRYSWPPGPTMWDIFVADPKILFYRSKFSIVYPTAKKKDDDMLQKNAGKKSIGNN